MLQTGEGHEVPAGVSPEPLVESVLLQAALRGLPVAGQTVG